MKLKSLAMLPSVAFGSPRGPRRCEIPAVSDSTRSSRRARPSEGSSRAWLWPCLRRIYLNRHSRRP